MSTYAIADLHGHLPEVPRDATTLLIAGDICPDYVDSVEQRQRHWLDTDFRFWLDTVVMDGIEVVATWGNHDWVGMKPFLVPDLPWTLLVDAGHNIADGRYVWGTPWVPNIARFAFYRTEALLVERAALVPEHTDILMPHGPPLLYGDFIPTDFIQAQKYGNTDGEHVGDVTLNDAIKRVKPDVTICGHIHVGRGSYQMPHDWHHEEFHRIENVCGITGPHYAHYKLLDDPWVMV